MTAFPRDEDGKIDLLACTDEQINELKQRVIDKYRAEPEAKLEGGGGNPT